MLETSSTATNPAAMPGSKTRTGSEGKDMLLKNAAHYTPNLKAPGVVPPVPSGPVTRFFRRHRRPLVDALQNAVGAVLGHFLATGRLLG